MRRPTVSKFHTRNVCTAIAMSALSLTILAGCGEGTTRQGTLYSIQANRTLETYLPGDLKAVHEAALQAVEADLGYTLEDSAVDATEGIVKARTALDHEVRVKMYKHAERVTRIDVFVGPRGAESVSRELLSAIETRLAGSAPGK
jgi:cytosine/adenosine deaminase-related metal-dependent hydrolase